MIRELYKYILCLHWLTFIFNHTSSTNFCTQ